MANLLILFTTFILSMGNPDATKGDIQDKEMTTYYLIRHAEKDRLVAGERDPELNAEGKQRAKNWSEVLREVKFDAIYSTDYKRTMQTAQPLAELNNLEILSYDPGKLYSEKFRKATRGKTVMVVGHSNTTPHFANAILGEKKYNDIDDSENGALFIVQLQADGAVHSQVLYIN